MLASTHANPLILVREWTVGHVESVPSARKIQQTVWRFLGSAAKRRRVSSLRHEEDLSASHVPNSQTRKYAKSRDNLEMMYFEGDI